jgi:hypothetical protein
VHAVTPGSFLLPACFPCSDCAALCWDLAGYVLSVGVFVADAAVPAGEGVLAATLVRSVKKLRTRM